MSGCTKCKKSSCNGCPKNNSGSEIANLQNQVAELEESVNTLLTHLNVFICGHPIMLIDKQADIDCFDLTTGLGSGCWEGWAIQNGATHLDSEENNFVTSNWTEKFIVQAGGIYAPGDTGGLQDVQLFTAEMPSHGHAINDPGHAHVIVDPGHDHPVTDPGHTHGGTGGSHTHTFGTNNAGLHEHSTGTVIIGDGNGGDDVTVRLGDAAAGAATSTEGLHSHSGTTDPSAAGITISNAFTGIDVTNAFTGISNQNNVTGIVVQNEGGDQAHENRPPYYASFYVIKIG